MLLIHNLLNAVVQRCGDEDVDLVVKVAQYIVGTSSYEHATTSLCSLHDGFTLELEQTLLRQTRLKDAFTVHVR